MKKKYIVKFVKIHEYIVEASNMDEAEDLALELDEDKDNDISWLIDPADEITVEELI